MDSNDYQSRSLIPKSKVFAAYTPLIWKIQVDRGEMTKGQYDKGCEIFHRTWNDYFVEDE